MTLSAHKLGAPAGIGALYLRDPSTLTPMLLGGPQESGLRAGTPNLLARSLLALPPPLSRSIFMRKPCACRRWPTNFSRISSTRSRDCASTRHRESIANTLNLTFPGVLGESLLIALDLEGIQVSMGSACAAGAVEPSHVLLAMGLTHDEARSSLRLSLGWNTTRNDIARAANIIPRVLAPGSEAETAD